RPEGRFRRARPRGTTRQSAERAPLVFLVALVAAFRLSRRLLDRFMRPLPRCDGGVWPRWRGRGPLCRLSCAPRMLGGVRRRDAGTRLRRYRRLGCRLLRRVCRRRWFGRRPILQVRLGGLLWRRLHRRCVGLDGIASLAVLLAAFAQPLG